MALTKAAARELVERHGSRRAAARAIGVHPDTIRRVLDPEAVRARERERSQRYRERHPGRHDDNQARFWAGLSPAERARRQLQDRRHKALVRADDRKTFSIATEIEILEGGQ